MKKIAIPTRDQVVDDHFGLTEQGIQVIRGCHGPVEQVLKAYLSGEISDSAESCSHHDCADSQPVITINTNFHLKK